MTKSGKKEKNMWRENIDGYFYTLYLINKQITNLEVVPDTDQGIEI